MRRDNYSFFIVIVITVKTYLHPEHGLPELVCVEVTFLPTVV